MPSPDSSSLGDSSKSSSPSLSEPDGRKVMSESTMCCSGSAPAALCTRSSSTSSASSSELCSGVELVEETVYSKAYRFESDEMLSLLMAETLGLYRRVGWRSRTAGVTSSLQSSESVAVSSRRSPSDSLVASFDFIVGVVGIGVSNADLVSTSIVASGSGSKSSPLGGLVPSGMGDFGRPKIVRDFS